MPNRVLYWFRTDLRLHDSPAFQAALDLQPEVLFPVWAWDPHYNFRVNVGPVRYKFLLESQQNLSDNLAKINSKQKLLVFRADPLTIIPALCKELKITHLVFEKDHDTYGSKRDKQVKEKVSKLGIKVITKFGRTLYDIDEILEILKNKAPSKMQDLTPAFKQIGEVQKPLGSPKRIPDPGSLESFKDTRNDHPVKESPDINQDVRHSQVHAYKALSGPKGDYSVPTLDELGIESDIESKFVGGENEALRRLDELAKKKSYINSFAKPKTNPGEFDPPATTLLSPYLHFGCLSVRKFYWMIKDAQNGQSTKPPESLDGQLLFREMFMVAQAATPKFEQMKGNPHCRYIDWHLANKYDKDGEIITGEYENDSAEARERFDKWRNGNTGFPWIDALMRQLKSDGWIHHLGRHSVAAFLTRGHCYISWERGAEVFEKYLVDHEAASNSGNWQWLSCSNFFSQYFRVYSPISFGKKWDPSGSLIRQYVPELKEYPDKYIYTPWEAPTVVQKNSKCIIGKDYPNPMLDEKAEKQKNLDRMSNAYKHGFRGADEKVLNNKASDILKTNTDGSNTKNNKRKSEQNSTANKKKSK